MSAEQAPRPGRLWFDSWAGRASYRIEVIGETPKRYRVRVLDDVIMRGWHVGDAVLVPRYAVTFDAAGGSGGGAD